MLWILIQVGSASWAQAATVLPAEDIGVMGRQGKAEGGLEELDHFGAWGYRNVERLIQVDLRTDGNRAPTAWLNDPRKEADVQVEATELGETLPVECDLFDGAKVIPGGFLSG